MKGRRWFLSAPWTHRPGIDIDEKLSAVELERDWIAEQYGLGVAEAGCHCQPGELWSAARHFAVMVKHGLMEGNWSEIMSECLNYARHFDGCIAAVDSTPPSKGMAMEIAWFEERGLPVVRLERVLYSPVGKAQTQ